MRSAILFLPALLFLLPACEEDFVHVRIRPKADGSFVRTVTMWRVDDEKPNDFKMPDKTLVEGARNVYIEAPDFIGGKLVFKDTFRQVPADIVLETQHEKFTNHGGYTTWRCRAGSYSTYRERRPGPTDHWDRFRKAAEGVDVGARILVAAAKHAFEGEAGLDRLVAWLESKFPTDMKDLMFLLAGAQGTHTKHPGEPESGPPAGAILVLHLLEERGYVDLQALPRSMTDEGGAPALTELLAGRMGRPVDEDFRKKVAGLCTEDGSQALFEKAFKTLGMSDDQVQDELEPLGELLIQISFGAEPHLTFELEVPEGARIVATSGRIEPEGNLVTWEGRLDSRPVTGIFFAFWTAPDRAWQEKHLGSVVLTGERLGEYVTWVEGLTPAQAKAWEDAVEALTPGEAFRERLAEIQVTPRDPDVEVEDDAEEGARLILSALAEAGK